MSVMARDGSAVIGIFSTPYFPEISDERSSYVSPLHAILLEIRRQNVAAAIPNSGPLVSTSNSSDPWDSLSSEDPLLTTAEDINRCLCRLLRRATSSWTGPRSPVRRQSSETLNVDDPNACPTCGKNRSSEVAGFARSYPSTRMARKKSSRALDHHTPEAALEEPQHALALLQSTPQLRIMSKDSIHMNEVGTSLLHFVMKQSNSKKDGSNGVEEYNDSLTRHMANQRAAAELASLLWTLAHEMSVEDFGAVESEVFTLVFALVHAPDKESRMAGLAALDGLLVAPSADEEKKAIKFANALSTGLRAANGDYEFFSAVSKALGHMAMRISNVDFVEAEVTRALEWLRTGRSDRRLAASLSLKEFAIHAPTTFHSKTSQSTLGQGGSNEFLDTIFQSIRDPQPIVRVCAADALSQCLRILVDRRHLSLTGLLCQIHFSTMEGLQEATKKQSWHAASESEAAKHGSLLVVGTMLAYTREFLLPRFEEICRAVLACSKNPKVLIRLEVVRLIPKLAACCSSVFGRRYLEQSLVFLIDNVSSPASLRDNVDIRPSVYDAIGDLIMAMSDENTGRVIGGSKFPTARFVNDPENPDICFVELSKRGFIFERLEDIFAVVRKGLHAPTSRSSVGHTLCPALHCASRLVEALKDLALPYLDGLIDDMFQSGLSIDLIQCLHSIAQSIPMYKDEIEDRMLQEVSLSLAGNRVIYNPITAYRAAALRARALRNVRKRSSDHTLGSSYPAGAASTTESSNVHINMNNDAKTTKLLVLSLQTFASFSNSTAQVTLSGKIIPLMPFVQDVTARYLLHPSNEVRRAAALACCVLLIPHGSIFASAGSCSGLIIEDVLEALLRAAVSDSSAVVRLCVVRALDTRYDPFLCQTHHLQDLFLVLQDETLATRVAGLQLLGRLASLNPAPILPVLRRFLNDLVVELQCGVDTGRGREEATRLLVVFLRVKPLQRLIHPVLATLVGALPLTGAAPPRLASASLEALGELAQATGTALQPWVNDIIPHVLNTMKDQSSASKQRTSLRTLGQIAGSTGYVVRLYLDYPNLLSQATDILPATKRAPWTLRREVIRTLGIIGALDPDRYYSVASKARKGGVVGGAYFEELDTRHRPKEGFDSDSGRNTSNIETTRIAGISGTSDDSRLLHGLPKAALDSDEDQPAYLSMYEQYAMVAQPVSNLSPAKRMTPSEEDFYPTVSIQALMRIFRDSTLTVHHGMVIQAIMFIFKSLGVRCVPFLGKVLPHMILTIRHCPSNLKESLFIQLSNLTLVVKAHLRIFVDDIFDIVEQFWDSRHLSIILKLLSNIAIGVPDAFRQFVPRFIRRLLTSLDELQVADWSTAKQSLLPQNGRAESDKLSHILKSISKLNSMLREYLHILIPALLKLADSLASLSFNGATTTTISILDGFSVLNCRTLSALIESQAPAPNPVALALFTGLSCTPPINSENGLPSRVVQPLLRIFRETPPRSLAVGLSMVETLCTCAKEIGASKWLQIYDSVVKAAITSWHNTFSLSPGVDVSISTARPDERLAAILELYYETVNELTAPPLLIDTSTSSHAISSRRSQSLLGIEGRASTNDMAVIVEGFDSSIEVDEHPVAPALRASFSVSNRQKVNQGNLQRAWDVSQRSSREDWDEWMRRFAIQLLREAPSPALRASANLAHAYQPLARELFSAAFACCWKELSHPYRTDLLSALETAFVADISPEILLALLNLAEFMEHDPSGGLPIDISILADLALKCRAYAKALHYKEREYRNGGSGSCVEALISINRKLDLQEGALGILKASAIDDEDASKQSVDEAFSARVSRHQCHDMLYSVICSTEEPALANRSRLNISEKEGWWLAKLGNWTEALEVYREKLKSDPHDFEAIVGCMRCLDASGEWRKVLDLAEQNWTALSQHRCIGDSNFHGDHSKRSQRKAVRMCAQAAWRLGQWDDLEKYSSQLTCGQGNMHVASSHLVSGLRDISIKRVGFDGAFYSAVLHVHRQDWSHAADAIDAARKAMDSRFTALLAESYSRAYPSMVTAQMLSEMEEIIEYMKTEERSRIEIDHHPANRQSIERARERLISVWKDRLAGCRMDSEAHASILAVRSLVIGPEDDVDAVLTLSKLSRQAERHKFAERVLLDPLHSLNAHLDGPTFGIGLSETLGIRVDFSQYNDAASQTLIDRVVSGNLSNILPTYGLAHEQWSRSLVDEAGGIDRYDIRF
jgi:FKBP12-rapamycin complex-associated protein